MIKESSKKEVEWPQVDKDDDNVLDELEEYQRHAAKETERRGRLMGVKLSSSDKADLEKIKAKIIGGDFISPPPPKEQAIALIFGQPGHGKTTLGLLYAPDPVAFFDVDRRGLYAARRAMRRKKVINYMPVSMPRKVLKMDDFALRKMAEAEVSKVRRNYELALKESLKGNIRTIVFDTMTEFASLINMAVTGRADRKKDDYGKSTDVVKTALADFIKMSRESNANLIMLARAKPIWEGGEPTGEYSYRGPDTLEFDADWAGHLRLTKQRGIKKQRDPEKGTQHEMLITKSGISLAELGQVYTEEEWGKDGPFVFACMQQYPGTTPEVWK